MNMFLSLFNNVIGHCPEQYYLHVLIQCSTFLFIFGSMFYFTIPMVLIYMHTKYVFSQFPFPINKATILINAFHNKRFKFSGQFICIFIGTQPSVAIQHTYLQIMLDYDSFHSSILKVIRGIP